MKNLFLTLGLSVALPLHAWAADAPAETEKSPTPDAISKQLAPYMNPEPEKNGAISGEVKDKIPAPPLTPRQNSDLLFKQRDLNHDGGLSDYEFVTYVQIRFDIIDIDRNGVNTIEEYQQRVKTSPDSSFKEGDADKDGKITQYESLQNGHRLFKMVDKDHDGNVTPDEYYESRQKPASR